MDGVFWRPQSSISSSETFQIDKTALVEVMLPFSGKALEPAVPGR
jgi:hypothetical protein